MMIYFFFIAMGLAQNCLEDRFGDTTTCASNVVNADIYMYNITCPPNAGDMYCSNGSTITLQLYVNVWSTATTKYDIGINLAQDGGMGLTGQCFLDMLTPVTSNTTNLNLTGGGGPYYDGDSDACGDIRHEDGMTTKYLGYVNVTCQSVNNSTDVGVHACVSWRNSGSYTCSSPEDAIPQTPALCTCGSFTIDGVHLITESPTAVPSAAHNATLLPTGSPTAAAPSAVPSAAPNATLLPTGSPTVSTTAVTPSAVPTVPATTESDTMAPTIVPTPSPISSLWYLGLAIPVALAFLITCACCCYCGVWGDRCEFDPRRERHAYRTLKSSGTYMVTERGPIALTQIPYSLNVQAAKKSAADWYPVQPNRFVVIQVCNNDPDDYIYLVDENGTTLNAQDPFHDGIFVYLIPRTANIIYMINNSGISVGVLTTTTSKLQEWQNAPLYLTKRSVFAWSHSAIDDIGGIPRRTRVFATFRKMK